MNTYNLPTWEYLAKELAYRKLSFAENLNILEFGSGNGAMANHLASKNTVVAKVSKINAFRKIAFFHHLLFKKNK